MRLWIFEKPSMAKAVIPHLPGPHVKKDGYVETGDGYVSWLAGHVLEQVGPDGYDEKWGTFPWKFEDLPIIPQVWKLKVSDDKRKQVNVIKDLLKKCTSVVNGGDADREGQLLCDEVLVYFNNKKPVERISLSAMDPTSVKKAIASLENNTKYFPLYEAGLGRQRADWLVGMNMSRAYTILAKKQNYPGVLSVGRVQSPTLALVVKRDREIENFVAKDFWTIEAQFADPNQPALPFWSRWLPPGLSLESAEKQAALDANGEADEEEEGGEEEDPSAGTSPAGQRPSWLDEQNRIVNKAMAEQIAAKVKQAGQGVVTRYVNKPAEEQPPLPYELTGLQTALNGKYGYSAKQVLDTCQELYLAGHTTYPRSDCPYLPESQQPEAPDVLAAIAQGAPHLAGLAGNADAALSSRAWDDKKVGEHHALIPTRQAPDWNALTEIQRRTYEVIAKNYLAQFYPNCLVDKAKVEVTIASERFAASGRVVKDPGWRVVFQGEAPAATDAKKAKEPATPSLPVLTEQSAVDCKATRVDAKRTTPPPRYTEGSLLTAMKHVYRTVTDPEERKKLKALDGIGRSATRAAIIETIIKRSFVEVKGKQLFSTIIGKILVDALPGKLVDPGMTARWETLLDGIASGKVPLAAFQQKQETWVTALVAAAEQTTLPTIPPEAMPARKAYSGGSGGARSGSGGAGAARAPVKAPPGAKQCPVCKKGHLVERTVKNGPNAGKKFFSCSTFPACKHSEWPK